MNFTDREKELLLSNAPVLSRITLYDEDGEVLQVFTEDDYLVDWELEDYRYVPEQGFIGQFVERLLDGHLMNIPDNISLEDKEIDVELAVVDSELEEQVYHNYGRFIITKIEQEDASGSYKFESSDYTKKFNIPFDGNAISYPCTALELLDGACSQAGVDLNGTNGYSISYIVGSDGLEAGNYCFLVNDDYYNFTLDEDLSEKDLLMLKDDILILRHVDSDYNIIRKDISYTITASSENTLLSNEIFNYYDFTNNDFVIEDNQFEEQDSCRTVVSAIAKLAYSWARINENNKLCLDFIKNKDVNENNEIDTDKYYEATVTGDEVKPVNKVLLSMSQVEGENIVKEQDATLFTVNTIYGDTEQDSLSKLLPDDYMELEYIENDNDQYIYIDNLKPTSKYRYVLEAELTNLRQYNCLWCSRYGAGGTSFTLFATTTGFRVDYSNVQNAVTYNIQTNKKYKFEINENIFKVDDATIYTMTSADFDIDKPTYLFATTDGTWETSAKIYSFEAYNENGELVNKMIPCMRISDNITGMYDTVNNIFYKSSSSTEFKNGIYNNKVKTVTGMNAVDITGHNLAKITNCDLSGNNYTLNINNGTINVTANSNNSFDLCNGTRAGTYLPSYTNANDYHLTSANNKTYMLSIQNLTYTLSSGSANQIIALYTNQRRIQDIIYSSSPYVYDTRIELQQDEYIKSIYLWTNGTTDISELEFNLQLEEGSTVTDYEQYKNQNYEVNLGKNLIPFTNQDFTYKGIRFYCKNGNLYFDGTSQGEISSNSADFKTNFSFYLDAGTYTVQDLNLTSGNRVIKRYDDNTNLVNLGPNNRVSTFTLNEKTRVFLGFYIYQLTFDNQLIEVQLEKGNEATSYSSYFEPIELCKRTSWQDLIYKGIGKNLLDNNNPTLKSSTVTWTPTYTGGKYSNSGTWGDGVTWRYILDVNKTYSLRIDNVTNNCYCYLRTYTDETYSTIKTNYVTDGTGNIRNTFQPNSKYVEIKITNNSATNNVNIYNMQLEESNSSTFFEPYGVDIGKWRKYKSNGEIILNENSDISTYTYGTNSYMINIEDLVLDYGSITMISDKFRGVSYNDRTIDAKYIIYGASEAGVPSCIIRNTNFTTLNDFTNWLSSNPVKIYYNKNIPTNEEITYQPLLDQLNALQSNSLFEGINYITVDSNNLIPQVDLDVMDLDQVTTSYTGDSFEVTGYDYTDGGEIQIFDNPLTHSEELRRIAINGSEKLFGLTYTPMLVESIGHPWLKGDDFIKVTNLEENDLYFYPFDRKIKYTGVLTTDLSAQSENEVSQKYENKNTVIDRLHHTEIDVDKANNQIKLLSQQIDGNVTNITQLQLDVNGINQQVEHIENNEITGLQSQLSSVSQSVNAITNMFQITGGINIIRNSAFLLTDNLWEFTDSGTNPYHTDLGTSYNSTLSGTTVSVAEIKLRSMKMKSKSENVTDLKTDGTKYTFNFYHKQDNDMTTTIKMYSTENNTVKAFDDIVITGQQEFKNYEVSFVPTYSNYTIEIIVTSTASVGYTYIYDMMLNSGDKQSWQPASDEIYSTTLSMSRLGLKVYSSGDGTITLLGSDGLLTYETSDGKTLGRLVSSRTVDGDRTRTITTQSIYLSRDITQENLNKWAETIVNISGSPYKVEYVESGGQ